jgi:DHA3 family multidrug efflux protein-like MFS transporter
MFVKKIYKRSIVLIILFSLIFSILPTNIGLVFKINAASGQFGIQQITLNPGGGIETDGSDGIRFTINSDSNSNFGSPDYAQQLEQNENGSEQTNTEESKKMDFKGTFKIMKAVPGLLSLIFFTTFNNFLGGTFMSLMDVYGLTLVSVEVWGVLWGGLSLAFILGGIIIAKKGLGKNPLRTLFLTNIIIWSICSIFTIQPSIVLLAIGSFIYLTVVPFIEASEHTIIQKVVPQDRLGRVFGFAMSVEQSASPITAFLIGPITQFIFIPLMTDGAGAKLIGSWYGTGTGRGIALVFSLVGIIGLTVTLFAMRSRQYKMLSKQYEK